MILLHIGSFIYSFLFIPVDEHVSPIHWTATIWIQRSSTDKNARQGRLKLQSKPVRSSLRTHLTWKSCSETFPLGSHNELLRKHSESWRDNDKWSKANLTCHNCGAVSHNCDGNDSGINNLSRADKRSGK